MKLIKTISKCLMCYKFAPPPLTYALLFQHLLYQVLVTGLDVLTKSELITMFLHVHLCSEQ